MTAPQMYPVSSRTTSIKAESLLTLHRREQAVLDMCRLVKPRNRPSSHWSDCWTIHYECLAARVIEILGGGSDELG